MQHTDKYLIELIEKYTMSFQRVRELHKPVTSYKGMDHDEIVGCYECEETGSGREYWVEYPCPTIKALDGIK